MVIPAENLPLISLDNRLNPRIQALLLTLYLIDLSLKNSAQQSVGYPPYLHHLIKKGIKKTKVYAAESILDL